MRKRAFSGLSSLFVLYQSGGWNLVWERVLDILGVQNAVMKLCDDKETSVKRVQITEFTCAELF